MAEIRAFRGVHFDTAKAGDASLLISPPYDVIGPEERDRLHQQSPYNFVRLVLGEERPEDTPTSNRFTRAGEFLSQWIEDGILVQDDRPCLYRQRIRFEIDGQIREVSGLIALIRLHDYSDGVILPHEKTLSGPKEDLSKLMAATLANLDSVWMIYEDNSGSAKKALGAAHWETLISGAADKKGVLYSLDRCSDASAIEAVTQALESEVITIADGHHRYETALNFSKILDKRHPDATERPWQWLMVTLVSTDDPGLTILPTHRTLRDLPVDLVAGAPKALESEFEVRQISPDSVKQTLEALDDSGFIYYTPESAFALTPHEPKDLLGAELSQDSVLAGIFGFDTARLKTDPRIRYVEHLDKAMALVESGGFQAAILLKPIPVRTITRYAREHRPMPQKSTYFYPKLASGLVLRLIEQEDSVV